ncbi:mannan-binding lectin serine protease 1-like isoform X2 [Penaeus chinensis]|uniref:mannan-binding lectin serine protease 1-like isoform X2 n=1 Tax=Penaeus chinensis TaxID=139456 RepID=UPI001FB6E924|nr:mannan-binding lectin serine protease 1-like isoform X2 [Penaeus chinensis]
MLKWLLLLACLTSVFVGRGRFQVAGEKNAVKSSGSEDHPQELGDSPNLGEILRKRRKENPDSSPETLTRYLSKVGALSGRERRGKGSMARSGKASCGKLYKLKQGAKRNFRVKGKEDFCDVVFEPKGKAKLELVCKKFSLSDCKQEHFVVDDQDSEDTYCGNERPSKRTGLDYLHLTYRKTGDISDKPNILCTVKGVKASGGGGGSSGTQASGCEKVCGKASESAGASKIVGGEASTPGEYPWMVFLSIIDGDLSYLCGGSILTTSHIITAAHCVDYDSPQVIVVAGEHNVNKEDETITQIIRGKKITMHPKFNSKTQANDIAIITLKSSLEWTENVGPICLPPDNTFENRKAVIIGWGLLDYPGSTFPDELQEAAVTVSDHKECKESYAFSNFPVTDKHICAADPGRDSCRGDSGGPLMTKENGVWVLFQHIGMCY